MLQFFRINDPYRLIVIFLILVIIRTIWYLSGWPLSVPELKWLVMGERLGEGFVMYRELYDTTGPLAAMVYKWMDIFFGRSRLAHVLVSTLLVTLQAGILNRILLRNKAYNENNYLPAFFYIILVSAIPDFFSLSPQLLALTFLLLALNAIFRRIDNVATDELFLLSGTFLGIAALFYLPAGIFLFINLLSFVLFSSAILRRLFLFFYGAAVVGLITWAYFFWFGAGADFLSSYFVAGFLKPKTPIISYSVLFSASSFLLAVAILSFSVLFTSRVTNFQQKMQQVMILFFLGGLVVVVFTKELTASDLLFFVPPIAFFLVYYFLGLRRRIWRFLLPYLVIGGLLAYSFYWLKQQNSSSFIVNDQQTELRDRNIMGIGVPIDYYLNNRNAGPFFDEYTSKSRLEVLDTYPGASDLYAVFRKSAPELIIDQWGAMPRVMEKFPLVKEEYQETGNGIYEKISN